MCISDPLGSPLQQYHGDDDQRYLRSCLPVTLTHPRGERFQALTRPLIVGAVRSGEATTEATSASVILSRRIRLRACRVKRRLCITAGDYCVRGRQTQAILLTVIRCGPTGQAMVESEGAS